MTTGRSEARLARGRAGVARSHGVAEGLGAKLRRRARQASPLRPLTVLILLTAVAPVTSHAQIRGVMVADTRPGRPAPGLELPLVTAAGVSATPYDLARELGLVVVLSFCPSLADEGCLAVWRGWQDAEQVFGSGVSVVGVTGDSAEVAVRLAARAGIRGRFLSDGGAREARRWGVRSSAGGRVSVYVIGPEGKIEYRDMQYDPLDSAAWGRLWQAVARVRMPSRR